MEHEENVRPSASQQAQTLETAQVTPLPPAHAPLSNDVGGVRASYVERVLSSPVVVAEPETKEANRLIGKHRKCWLSTLSLCILFLVVASTFVAVIFILRLSGSKEDTEDSWGANTTIPLTRLIQFREVLASVSDPSTLVQSNPPKPQYQALLWLANVDGKKVPVPTVPTEGIVTATGSEEAVEYMDVVQRYVAAVWYYAMDGPSWDKQFNFLSELDECFWNSLGIGGIYCGRGNNPDRPGDASFSFIEELYFSRGLVVLRGTLPEELGHLHRLQRLLLNQNDIFGAIPSSIARLAPTLTSMLLASNRLTGTIPSYISEFEKLRILQLDSNGFRGTVPASFAGLRTLEVLTLQENQLTGSLNFLCQNKSSLSSPSSLVVSSDCGETAPSHVECECCGACFPE